jgi:mono/diheme cytochrome c family protein
VRSRFRLAVATGALLALAGCGDYSPGPITYAPNEKRTTDLKGKPQLQAAVDQALASLFGPDPQHMKVPKGLNLPMGGIYLANSYVPPGDAKAPSKRLAYQPNNDPKAPKVQIEGGYALYRRHCLHCHGVSGDGKGPTAEFLWPRPRDYRPGKFKFTSTTSDKPTREDLRKTINQGIANSSMPAFEALMTPEEIEQVLDYVIFLSARGQCELSLINAATLAEESEAKTVFEGEALTDAVQVVFDAWNSAESLVYDPPIPRVPSTPESIANGRSLFLGYQTAKGLQCVGCHGPKADGNGSSFVSREVFLDVTFGGDPDKMQERLNKYDDKTKALWKDGSIDDWGNPLRAANLNLGMYKGGRRPLDIYWRIAKGINGAKMPAHNSILQPKEIWDLVNFVLALPYDKSLLENMPPAPAAPAAKAPAVARR